MENRPRTRGARKHLAEILLALLTIASQTACEPEEPLGPVAQFDAFVSEALCSDAYDTECLEVLTHNACSSGCPRTGYNLRNEMPGRLDGHLTLGFLRELRDAASYAPNAVAEHSLGLSLSGLLWSQIQMMLTHPSARFYDADWNLLDPGAVRTRNSVDPTKFYSVTWVNEGGSAHAMVQADLAVWFLSLALGVPESPAWYLRLSENAFRSFGIPHEAGGVRNDRAGNRCFDGFYCYWFHSFVAGDEDYPMSVLNQHLHAVRDSLIAHEVLSGWRDYGRRGPDGGVHPLPAEFDSDHIDHLLDWGRGGLFQLAYGQGNEAISNAPPNLDEFLAEEEVIDGVQRFRAHYRYDMGIGPADITAANNCGYHYHDLKLFADILLMIGASPYFTSDPELQGVYYKLLYGRNTGDTRSCNNRSSIPPSRRVMRGIPLAELYLGGVLEQDFQNACTKGQPAEFRGGLEDFSAATPFFDTAYEDCVF